MEAIELSLRPEETLDTSVDRGEPGISKKGETQGTVRQGDTGEARKI